MAKAKVKEKPKAVPWQMKAQCEDLTHMDYLKARFSLGSRAAAVRFALNFAARNARLEEKQEGDKKW